MQPFTVTRGPFLTRSEASARSGVPPGDLPTRPDLVALGGGHGLEEVYPAFLFSATGAPLAGLAEVLTPLRSTLDPWSAAAWLCSPHPSLGSQTPAAWLRDGGRVERVIDLAQRLAA